MCPQLLSNRPRTKQRVRLASHHAAQACPTAPLQHLILMSGGLPHCEHLWHHQQHCMWYHAACAAVPPALPLLRQLPALPLGLSHQPRAFMLCSLPDICQPARSQARNNILRLTSDESLPISRQDTAPDKNTRQSAPDRAITLPSVSNCAICGGRTLSIGRRVSVLWRPACPCHLDSCSATMVLHSSEVSWMKTRSHDEKSVMLMEGSLSFAIPSDVPRQGLIPPAGSEQAF